MRYLCTALRGFGVAFSLLVLPSYLLRAQTDGTLDTAFDLGSGPNYIVRDMAIQPDGKILVGGDFDSFNGVSKRGIVRLNSDGTLDTTFRSGSGTGGSVRAIQILPSGKVYLAGQISSYNGVSCTHILRINADGTLDPSFNTGAFGFGFVGYIDGMIIQPDSKVVVWGTLEDYNGTPTPNGARFTPNGSLDPSFSIRLGTDEFIWKMVRQTNGRFLAAIGNSSATTNIASYFVRLNGNGSLDNTFSSPRNGFMRTINSLALQPDGKLLVGGGYTSFNGQTQNRLARLMPDGTLDPSFNIGAGFDFSVNKILLQQDGKILVSGGFSDYNGTRYRGLVRLMPDGSLDPTFSIGTGFSSNGVHNVYSMTMQPDGKLLLWGFFSEYNGVPKKDVVRIFNTSATAVSDGLWPAVELFPNPTRDKAQMKSPFLLKRVRILNLSGAEYPVRMEQKPEGTLLHFTGLPPGLYLVEAQGPADQILRRRLVVQ